MYTRQRSGPAQLREGMPVEVATHYTGTWARGFEVAALHDETCRVRRVSDGSLLPLEFGYSEVRATDDGPEVGGLIDRFARAKRPFEVEAIADELGATGDRRAIRPLLARLGDCCVQEDADVEDSVCRALVALDVMRTFGNLSFALRPHHLLAPDVIEMIEELGPAVPMRYLIARQV